MKFLTTDPIEESLPLYLRIRQIRQREAALIASTELALDAIPRDSRYSQSKLRYILNLFHITFYPVLFLFSC